MSMRTATFSSVGPMAFKTYCLTLKAIEMIRVLTYNCSRQPVEITPSGSGSGFLGLRRRGAVARHWARPDSHGEGMSYAVYPLCLSAQAAPRAGPGNSVYVRVHILATFHRSHSLQLLAMLTPIIVALASWKDFSPQNSRAPSAASERRREVVQRGSPSSKYSCSAAFSTASISGSETWLARRRSSPGVDGGPDGHV